MALYLRRKNRAFESVKKAIKPEGFKDALEARHIAVLRGAALALEETEGLNSHHEHTTAQRNSYEEVDMPPATADRAQATAQPMSVDHTEEIGHAHSPATAWKLAREERRMLKQQKLAELKTDRARQRAERAAEQERLWNDAERKRTESLQKLKEERRLCLEQSTCVAEELEKLSSTMERMNEEKAKLVSHLKQVLHVDDSSRPRAPSAPFGNGGEDTAMGGQDA